MAILGYARSEPISTNSALAYAIRYSSSTHTGAAHGHSRPADAGAAHAGAADAGTAHAGPARQHCSSSDRYGRTSDSDSGAAHQDGAAAHGY